ncbi:MAG: DUF998 domain-containing protein [Candidatus Anstonellaceae archaeon]
MSGKPSLFAICGILAPIVAFAGIFGAIFSYPQFSWTENALSDLGVVPGITSVLFNYGLIIAGALTLAFSTNLRTILPGKFGELAAILFALVAIDLAAIGIFTEEFRPTHYYVSVFFFAAFPISLFLAAASLYKNREKRLALLTLALSLAAVAAWGIQTSVGFGKNVAIPETIAALSVGVWAAVMGWRMLKR